MSDMLQIMKSNTSRKLNEAKYFHFQMVAEFKKSKKEYIYHLNAFLNAARSVTFVMQKEFKSSDGFGPWYIEFRASIPQVYKDFIEIRNISVKEKSIEPLVLSGRLNLFPKGLKLAAKSSVEIAFTPDPVTKKAEITVTYSNGKVERSTRPLMMDFVIYEEGDKEGQAIIIDDFMRVSREYLLFLEDAARECERKFTAQK